MNQPDPQPCPRLVELRLVTGRPLPAPLAQHADACPHCRAEWAARQQLLGLLHKLPAEMPDPVRLEQVRTGLLARARSGPAPRRPLRWAPTLAIATAAVLGLGGIFLRAQRPQPPTPRVAEHATVHPIGHPRYLVRGTARDEVVELSDGSVLLEVQPLAKGERFRVRSGSSEVEVRGTRFTATAAQGELRTVQVFEGRVEVRPTHRAMVILSSGDHWDAGESSTPAALAAATIPSTAAPARPQPSLPQTPSLAAASTAPIATRSSPRGPSNAEHAFERGWAALVQHRYARAAEEFRRAAELAPGQALAEDAWYWHGIALARGGMKRQAIAVLRRFVLDYASSARHSEVAAMLGWLLLDGAEYKEAERMFQLARQSSRTEVRSSGESGLEALKSRRAAPHAQTRQGAVR